MKVEEFAVFLFDLCQDRANSLNDIAENIALKLGRFSNDSDVLESVIRNYRTTGSGLEDAAKRILFLFGESIDVVNRSDINYEDLLGTPKIRLDSNGNKFDESVVWVRPTEPNVANWSKKDIALALVELETGDDVFESCLTENESGFYYEDSEYALEIDLVDHDTIHELAIDSLKDYIYQCEWEVAYYGLTGIQSMDLSELVETAYGCDRRWQELANDEGILIILD